VRRRQAQEIEKLAANPAARSAPASPAPAPPDDTATPRRLANLLERALLERGPQYRRRTDFAEGQFPPPD
jgi:hypothetical protein